MQIYIGTRAIMGLDWKKEKKKKHIELACRREKLLCFSTFSNVSPILNHSSESIPAKAIKTVQFKVC